MKVEELEGVLLDCFVAKALNPAEKVYHYGSDGWGIRWHGKPKAFSTDWAHGGPIIQAEGILVSPPESTVHVHGGPNPGWQEKGYWSATIFRRPRLHQRRVFDHKTEPLVAAMRAFVQSKFGDEVQPDTPTTEAATTQPSHQQDQAQAVICQECGDTCVAHNPGVCGTCYATKYRDARASQDQATGDGREGA